jgi:hypothetical protein
MLSSDPAYRAARGAPDEPYYGLDRDAAAI